MSTSDLTVTLVGWVGTEPRHYTGTGITPFTSFRMATTRRRFDRAQSTWTDGRTEWFTVKVWRAAAVNVALSLRKGDPVLVHGRLATEQWDSPEGPRTSLVLETLALGPDLTYGRAAFARTVHVTGPGTGEVPGDHPGDDDAAAEGPGDDPWATGPSDAGDVPTTARGEDAGDAPTTPRGEDAGDVPNTARGEDAGDAPTTVGSADPGRAAVPDADVPALPAGAAGQDGAAASRRARGRERVAEAV